MSKLVECVPNFSEGRRQDVIEAITAAVTSIHGVRLLDVKSDASHNRCVVTFIGAPEVVREAAFASCARAAELIDMEQHRGAHPRIGATDVIPFIPVQDVSMEECVQLANDLGASIAGRLHIPVYLYEEAARIQSRRSLPVIRKGEYEGLKEEITSPERRPDYGEPKLHPTAGATVVGARPYLIAYNINLATGDVRIAKKIANSIREARGGYRYVRAMGVLDEERNLAQVTINMVNYEGTPLFRVFETVKSEAARYGVSVVGSEIVGLAPLQAFLDVAAFYLQLENFDRKQVLEERVMSNE
jgi:glutamate formiminotransferase